MIKKFEAFRHVPIDVLNNVGKDGKASLKLDFTDDDIEKLENKGFDLINPKLMSCVEGKYRIDVFKSISIETKPVRYIYTFKVKEGKEDNKIAIKDSVELYVKSNQLIDHHKATFDGIFDRIYLFLKKHNVKMESEDEIVQSYLKHKSNINSTDPYQEEDWGNIY
jgi:hypothetical protein